MSNTIHVLLEPNGKGEEVQQIVELRLTAEEHSYLRATNDIAKQSNFTDDSELECHISAIDQRYKILKKALDRQHIKNSKRRQVEAILRL